MRTGITSAALARKGGLHRRCLAMLQVTVRSGGVERRVAVCRQCHRTCLAKSNLRQQQQQQQFAADSNSAIGKHWLATWLSCSMLHESSCIPSVMVEYRYAGVDRAAGY